MDLGSRLANLSLAEIASMLNTKQQEILLASISVAARFIQQLQAEEQLHHAQDEQDRLQAVDDELQQLQQQQQHQQQQHQHQQLKQQHHHHRQQQQQQQQQQQLQHHNQQARVNHLEETRRSIGATTKCEPIDDDFDDEEEEEDDDDDQHVDRSSDISFEDYSCVGQSMEHSAADRQTLLTIREFAEELKHRRKSIRLSQKGAAQSLRAFTSGEQPCTDAIIYHFENLQLEPDRAMQLIPLLRDWLDWAEKHRLNGKQLPMQCAVTKVPRERKRKVVLFNEKAKQYLEDAFLKNNHPDRYQLDVISQELNIPTRSIRKWFTNRRQRKRFAEKFSPVS